MRVHFCFQYFGKPPHRRKLSVMRYVEIAASIPFVNQNKVPTKSVSLKRNCVQLFTKTILTYLLTI